MKDVDSLKSYYVLLGIVGYARTKMNEAGLWAYLRKGMTGRWAAMRIENLAGSGMPDVFYAMPNVCGFIELKYMKSAPKRETTKIKIHNFRPEQKLWFKKFGSLINTTFMFVRIENEFYLWRYPDMLFFEDWDLKEWRQNAYGYWERTVNWGELTGKLNLNIYEA